jgi:putative ABC transport system permease protein
LARLWLRTTYRRAWLGLVFVGLLVGLGAAVVAVALVGAERTRTALDRAIAGGAPPRVQVQTDDPATLTALDGVDGLRAWAPLSIYVGSVDGWGGDVTVKVTGTPAWSVLDRIALRSGRLPAPGMADEVVLTNHAADVLGRRVGDTFTYSAVSPDQLERYLSSEVTAVDEHPAGPSITLHVVGIGDTVEGRLPTNSSDVNVLAGPSFAAMYSATAGHFGGSDGIGGMAVLWLTDGTSLETVEAAVRDHDPTASLDDADQARDPVRRTTRTLALALDGFAATAGIALVAGLAVLLTRAITRSARDHDTLGALGVHRARSIALRAAEVAPVAVVAGMIAGVGVAIGARLTPFGASARHVDPAKGATPSVLTIGVTVVATVVLVSSVAFLSAVLATRPRRLAAVGASGLTRRLAATPTAAIGAHLAGAPRARSGRVPSRSALGAAVVGVAMVMAGTLYAQSLRDLHDDPARWGWTWSLSLDDFDPAGRPPEEVLASRADVAGYGVLTDTEASADGIEVRAMAVDVVGGTIPFAMTKGRAPLGPNEVVVGPGLARRTGARIGDVIRASSPAGIDVPLTVVGHATLYPNDSDSLGDPAMLLTKAGLTQVALSDGTSFIVVRAAPGTTDRELYGGLKALAGRRLTPEVYAFADPPTEIANADQLRPVAFALAGFVGALALAVVASALVTTPRRWRSELSTLRALGFRPVDAAKAVGWQALIIAATGAIVGSALGTVGARLAFTRLAHDAYVAPGRVVVPWTVAAVAATAIALVVLWALWPARRAARLPVAAVLRAE